MKLISFNIGVKIDNSASVADFILQQKPDIVAFQEIIQHFDESVLEMYQSKAHIEERIGHWFPHKFFGPLWICDAMRKHGKMHRDFHGLVEQGNEVLSRFPFVSGTNEFFYKDYALKQEWADFHTEDHPRAVQIVEMSIEGRSLQILNLHGCYSRDKRDSDRTLDQSRYVLEAAKRKNLPTIIVGDFNLFPNTESIKLINQDYRNLIKEFGVPSTRPTFDDGTDTGDNVVGYIFTNDLIKVHRFDAIKTQISDHFPLILEFDLVV